MKRTILGFFLLGLVSQVFAQPSGQIVIGKIDSVKSNVLNETRKIWVYVPNQQNSIYGSQRYPVVYLLDGDAHFHAVTGLIQQLGGQNALCPEMIVVAIPNTDRTRDLTPTHSLAGPDGKDQGYLASSGGGENFTAFLEKELIPYVESHYPVAPHRMLIGHSFGGLFVINALVHHPQLFNSYVSIDPSLWWDHQKLLGQATAVLKSDKVRGKSLYLGIANTMPAGMDTARVWKDTTSNTFHIRSILQFAKNAQSNSSGGLRFYWRYYPADNHGSVPLITEYDALHAIFDYYRPPVRGEQLTADLLISHYKNVSEKIGYAIPPPESEVNNAGYAFLQQKKYDKAFMFFKLNIDNYPKSFNVYDSMGDYYVAQNDKPQAIEYFSKALALREYPETREKLEKLKKAN